MCVRVNERTTHHRLLSIFMYLNLLDFTVGSVAIDNILFFNFSGIISLRSFNLLNVLLKDVCNISDNKFALQIRKKNIHIFLDVLLLGLYFLGLSLHAVLFL